MVYGRLQVAHLLEGAPQVVMYVLLNELPRPPLVHAQRLPAPHAAVSYFPGQHKTALVHVFMPACTTCYSLLCCRLTKNSPCTRSTPACTTCYSFLYCRPTQNNPCTRSTPACTTCYAFSYCRSTKNSPCNQRLSAPHAAVSHIAG